MRGSRMPLNSAATAGFRVSTVSQSSVHESQADRQPIAVGLGDVLRRAFHPPVGDRAFWLIQVAVVGFSLVHLVLDASGFGRAATPVATLPVAALVLPVAYAAVRYGLHGSAATAMWATVLWLPALVFHPMAVDRGNELLCLGLVDAVGIFVGQRIEHQALVEEAAHAATSGRRASEARYRQLFAMTRAPILLLDRSGRIVDANPASWAILGRGLLDTMAVDLLGMPSRESLDPGSSGRVQLVSGGQEIEFRYLATALEGAGDAVVQVILQDVTAEHRAWRDVRAYADALLRAQEEERAFLARELHDDPLQRLVHLTHVLEAVPTEGGLPAGCAEHLEGARVEAVQIAVRLRDIARGLRPPALDQLGLVAALEGFLAEVEDATGRRVPLSISGEERRLPLDTELGLFRIGQEAVNNALAHSGDDGVSIAVGLVYEQALVRLSIVDNGGGFDSMSTTGSSRLGLRGMRERVSLLGGTLDIVSSPSRGTSVSAVVPVLDVVVRDTGRGPSD